MTATTAGPAGQDARAALLRTFGNLSATHREHEKHYGAAPLETARHLLGGSTALRALAERWAVATPGGPSAGSPFAGADDLNDLRAVEGSGILFMESGGPPVEIEQLLEDLDRQTSGLDASGTWLADAMETSWAVAETLLDLPELTDLVAERHAIIAHDWQSASLQSLAARQLRRARAILSRVDFSVAGLRADLAGPRRASALLFAAAEMIDQAADLIVDSATLVRQNERRWRVFHERVDGLRRELDAAPLQQHGGSGSGPRAGEEGPGEA